MNPIWPAALRFRGLAVAELAADLAADKRRCASQELVQPGGVVTDLRTEVTGVSAADLEGVTATRDQVRAAVLDAVRRLAAGGRQASALASIRPGAADVA